MLAIGQGNKSGGPCARAKGQQLAVAVNVQATHEGIQCICRQVHAGQLRRLAARK